MLDETTLALMADRHVGNRRQGPGSDVVFAHALVLSGIDTNALLRDENGGRVEGDSPMESVH